MYTEPCSNENQCTYLFFCTLGGIKHPQMRRIERRNGSYSYFTYHYLRY